MSRAPYAAVYGAMRKSEARGRAFQGGCIYSTFVRSKWRNKKEIRIHSDNIFTFRRHKNRVRDDNGSTGHRSHGSLVNVSVGRWVMGHLGHGSMFMLVNGPWVHRSWVKVIGSWVMGQGHWVMGHESMFLLVNEPWVTWVMGQCHWVMGHMGHRSMFRWVTLVVGHFECNVRDNVIT